MFFISNDEIYSNFSSGKFFNMIEVSFEGKLKKLSPFLSTFKEARNRLQGIKESILRNQGIDSACLCSSNRILVPAHQAENRFLGSLKRFTNSGSDLECRREFCTAKILKMRLGYCSSSRLFLRDLQWCSHLAQSSVQSI